MSCQRGLADFNGPNEFGMSARLIDGKNGQKLADVLFDIIRWLVLACNQGKMIYKNMYYFKNSN